MKKILKSVALVMSLALVLGMTAFAAEPIVTSIGDEVLYVDEVENDTIQPRFPNRAHVYSIQAYAGFSTGQYITNAYTYVNGFTGQTGRIALNEETRAYYELGNCDSVYVEFVIDKGGADTYEFYVDGKQIGQGAFGNSPSGMLDKFSFIAPVDENGEADWKIVLHNYGDTNKAGYPLYGYVTLE